MINVGGRLFLTVIYMELGPYLILPYTSIRVSPLRVPST